MMMAEVMAGSVRRAFGSAGVDFLVFKGPVIERWLYGGDDTREVGDLDVIVPRAQLHDAERVLAGLGFVSKYDDQSPSFAEAHGDTWFHEKWLPVDLHRRLWGMGVHEAAVWQVISRGHDTELFAGEAVPVPRRAVHLVLMALHAAHHGDESRKPRVDLTRAIALTPFELWQEACAVAKELRAIPAFTAGLHLLPAGADLAQRLELPDPGEVPWLAERYERYLPPTAEGFMRLAEASGWRAKRALLRHELLPSPTFMRLRSARAGVAQRGKLGLAWSYVLRWFDLARNAAPGYRHARRFKQES
jgi:hypothetical protein